LKALYVFSKYRSFFFRTNMRSQLTVFAIFALSVHLAAQGSLKIPKGGLVPPSSIKPLVADDPLARAATNKLVEKYSLNADQAKQMYGVQVKKNQHLSEIAFLKESNKSLYISKLQTLQAQTVANIRRILKSKEQVSLFQKTQQEVRDKRALKKAELTRQNYKKEEIEWALLEIYDE
jgi:hypothetical protein